ncbi:MAG: alpha/beta hydrolase [Phycisphaerae bacterium]|nr:alpha/beta hydrolase [Phycisphaerae bacterium]
MGILLLLALGFLLFESVLVLWTLRTLTRPPRRTYAWALAKGRPGDPSELSPPRPFRAFTFTSRALELPAWEITGDDPQGPTIVFTHGWAESRHSVLPRLAALAPLASRVIAWDLPGMGDAPGTCSIGARETEDLLALLRTLGTPAVLMGFSLGAGISIAAAARDPALVRAVIAEAPYRRAGTPARAVLRARAMPYTLNLSIALGLLGLRHRMGWSWPDFDRQPLARALRVPLLVIVGQLDPISPPADARDIAGPSTLVTIPSASHLDLWDTPDRADQLSRALRDFITTLPPAPA